MVGRFCVFFIFFCFICFFSCSKDVKNDLNPPVSSFSQTVSVSPSSTFSCTPSFTCTYFPSNTNTATSTPFAFTPTPTYTYTCCFNNYPILENPLIYKSGNNVTFTITYRDTCGDWPSDFGVVVFIQGLGGYDMDLINGSDPTVGLLYRKQITLPNGSYQYYYLTEDRCDYGTFYPCQSIPNASCLVVDVP